MGSMMGSGGTSQISGFTPQMLPPNYAFNRDFYNQILPQWVNYMPPNFQQAGGRMGRAPSPTQQAATLMAQQWAMSPLNQEMMGFSRGVLGNLMGTGGGVQQWHSPTMADNALNRFLDPTFINPSAGSGAPWADAFNLGQGWGPYGGGPWAGPRQAFYPPGPMTGGGPGMGTGIFTPPGQGQPNGRGGQG